MIYTYLIGYGYVEDAMNTTAIFNVNTDESDISKAVEEFISVLRTAGTNEEIQRFFYEYFHYTADGQGSIGDFENIIGIEWWGTICDGPIISLYGFNHFFDDPKKDSSHLLRCQFETVGENRDTLNVREIWGNTIGKDVIAEETDEEIPEGDRMFTDRMDMVYQMETKGSRIEITFMTLKAYNRGSGMKIHLDKTFMVGTDPCDIAFWIKKNVAKSSTMVTTLEGKNG